MRDVDEIVHYLEQVATAEVGERFIGAFETTALQIAVRPWIGTPQRWTRAMRMWRVHNFVNYLIYYRLMRNGIDVVRVVHAARDRRRMLRRV